MTHEPTNTPPSGDSRAGETEPLLEEVQGLTWALIDERISDEELSRLEQVLKEDAAARETYLGCVELHVGLHQCFAETNEDDAAVECGRSPVLGFLNHALPPLDTLHPSHDGDSGS